MLAVPIDGPLVLPSLTPERRAKHWQRRHSIQLLAHLGLDLLSREHRKAAGDPASYAG